MGEVIRKNAAMEDIFKDVRCLSLGQAGACRKG